ncbi:hypothetical protein LCI18_005404 [Fusarium solani-melongenae]|uniref:Uncharacterized protein n=1 Tax=Fusarium solani subsp. cucurbitae TaxID=2747967 RepID=A0ACD3YZU5_FUSSC|nr:hypothetical protein LCI18_005404 [Fusarium solani-melongenae]
MLKPQETKMESVKPLGYRIEESWRNFTHKVELNTRPLRAEIDKRTQWLRTNVPLLVKSRAFQRAATLTTTFILTVAFIVVTIRLTNATALIPQVISKMTKFPTCSSINYTGTREIWEKSRKKYEHLADDKFTIAMQTYRRPKELENTLKALLTDKIPSLQEIVVVWNDLEAEPPEDYVSKHGVPVRYRKSKKNSLNEKLWPDPDYKTQAILLSDDDVYYRPGDLEFVFQTWRKFGRNRLTGALARCSPVDLYGNSEYTFCNTRKGEDRYSMVLSGLAFSHMSFLDYYASNDTAMNQIRDYVDEGFNCEDIALNYVHSMLTGEGPLLVSGNEKYVNYVPREGISRKTGHMDARSTCLNEFSKMLGCFPLVEETAYIQRGVIVV